MSVTVYTRDLCRYCDAAKDLLTRMRVPFNEAKIGTDVTREELLEVAPVQRQFHKLLYNTRLLVVTMIFVHT